MLMQDKGTFYCGNRQGWKDPSRFAYKFLLVIANAPVFSYLSQERNKDPEE